ncbi:hypothetical protein M0220_14035 [Halomonas qinghailakensis]|uniref:Uncharacterized protein n=1 Tax=Halomonas qinghailakensis TaxID=2937790 RepID=A0AA46TR08_9GAMM|nr:MULTISPECIES: hypothetical protein [Halomonas]UYO73982.1 hypothetical protein M0220_14035 [Halomonas sp. ZZQ-149]
MSLSILLPYYDKTITQVFFNSSSDKFFCSLPQHSQLVGASTTANFKDRYFNANLRPLFEGAPPGWLLDHPPLNPQGAHTDQGVG